jgi:MATE family multidrug resistance protein
LPDQYIDYHSLVVRLLRFVALYTLFDMAALIFSGALRGAGDTRFVMGATLGLGISILAVPVYVICEFGDGSLFAAWGFITAYVMALGAAFFARFQTGAWRSMRVIETASETDSELAYAPSLIQEGAGST